MNLSAVDNFRLWIISVRSSASVSAPVLATGKGWVLAMLAMLAAKGRLRVAARGSGPGAKPRRPCPPLCAGAWRRCRDEGRPATIDAQEGLPARRRTKGWRQTAGAGGSRLPHPPSSGMALRAARKAVQRPNGALARDHPNEGQTASQPHPGPRAALNGKAAGQEGRLNRGRREGRPTASGTNAGRPAPFSPCSRNARQSA